MNKKETILKIINCYKVVQEKDRAINIAIDGVSTDYFGGVFTVEIEEALSEVAKAALDKEVCDWVDWFVYENDFGNSQLEAGKGNSLKTIKSTKDFMDLMDSLEYLED